jgi:hypothetical protein
MRVLFYDRKNQQEVWNDQLMDAVSFVEYYVAVDDEGMPRGTPIKTLTDKYGPECTVIGERRVADFIYKSEWCPKHQNWDKWCNLSDLVVLRLQEAPRAPR